MALLSKLFAPGGLVFQVIIALLFRLFSLTDLSILARLVILSNLPTLFCKERIPTLSNYEA